MNKEIWKHYDFNERLLHLTFVLDWRDGYPEHEEGTSIAVLNNYEFNFNDEYESLVITRLLRDGSKQGIYRTAVHLFMVWDAIICAKGFAKHAGGPQPFIWGKESLIEVILEELGAMTDILFEVTPEGKFISYETPRVI